MFEYLQLIQCYNIFVLLQVLVLRKFLLTLPGRDDGEEREEESWGGDGWNGYWVSRLGGR
jgi:hypothetical protein